MKNILIIFLLLCSIKGFSQVPITRTLSNVNNTADSLKPVSKAQATINTSLQSSITTHTANIATNAANISTNATAINAKLNTSGDIITGDLGNTTTGFFRIANGTTAQRPVSPLNGMLRYNTDVLRNEFYSNGAWRTHARLEGDTFTGNISATNLSGTNSGDETNGTIQTKLGIATTLTNGYLTSTDWNTFNNKQTLLGFTPYNATNPSGFISAVPAQTFFSLTGKPTTLGGYGITDSYPLTGNPSAFLTSINLANVTTALGFTPYNATNPNGYITSSSLSGYLPLTGGNLTGTSGNGFISYPTQSANPTTPANGFSLFANSTNALSWKGANGFVRTFDGTSNNADQIYTLPNASGKFPLLESSQVFSGTTNSFTNNLLVGTNTNSGFKLDVQGGNSRFNGQVSIQSLLQGDGSNDFNIRNLGNTKINFISNTGTAVTIISNSNVGVGTQSPTSTLQINGSQAGTLLSISTNTTLANQQFIIITASVALTLPTASTCSGRFYIINARSTGVTVSSYTDLTGTSQTTITNGTSVMLISDGTSWQRVE